jgi:hypothetical protein
VHPEPERDLSHRRAAIEERDVHDEPVYRLMQGARIAFASTRAERDQHRSLGRLVSDATRWRGIAAAVRGCSTLRAFSPVLTAWRNDERAARTDPQ